MADSLCRAVGQDLIRIFLASKAYCAYTGKSELGGEFEAFNCPFPFKGVWLYLTAVAAWSFFIFF